MYILKSVKIFDRKNPNLFINNDSEKMKKMLKGIPIIIGEFSESDKSFKENIIGFVQSNIKEENGMFYANVILRTDEHKDARFNSFKVILNTKKENIDRFGIVRKIVAISFK